MKRFEIFIRCRELPSAHAEYTFQVNASNFSMAVLAGLRQFHNEPHVKRRRLGTLEIRVASLGKVGALGALGTIVLPLYDKEEHGS